MPMKMVAMVRRDLANCIVMLVLVVKVWLWRL